MRRRSKTRTHYPLMEVPKLLGFVINCERNKHVVIVKFWNSCFVNLFIFSLKNQYLWKKYGLCLTLRFCFLLLQYLKVIWEQRVFSVSQWDIPIVVAFRNPDKLSTDIWSLGTGIYIFLFQSRTCISQNQKKKKKKVKRNRAFLPQFFFFII